jgi:hypothetical protein
MAMSFGSRDVDALVEQILSRALQLAEAERSLHCGLVRSLLTRHPFALRLVNLPQGLVMCRTAALPVSPLALLPALHRGQSNPGEEPAPQRHVCVPAPSQPATLRHWMRRALRRVAVRVSAGGFAAGLDLRGCPRLLFVPSDRPIPAERHRGAPAARPLRVHAPVCELRLDALVPDQHRHAHSPQPSPGSRSTFPLRGHNRRLCLANWPRRSGGIRLFLAAISLS